MINVPEIFGSMVFNDKAMKSRLDGKVYTELMQVIKQGAPLKSNLAKAVAEAMRDWAIEKGATHFTHWFQPMTGITAEKHDSFIVPAGDDSVIMEFSGKELMKGEPDASSFPNGGLRSTFEARGYTAWDPTSFAFIKDGTLCIPTVFYSYSGQVLDKKTPLIRSTELLNKQALRILKLFNTNASRVYPTVGAEQEYFLVDKKLFNKRKDLVYCGRTLFGAKPPKGQELEDHYFGAIKPRVSAFMKELDEELWKLGILAKTEHNEAAPSQHELAPIFTHCNVATDHNQLTMEMMKKIADKHGLVCLLHEKPFAGVNGSGKHNNWSMSTDTGLNLLEPGTSPKLNAQFLTFLSAIIRSVDIYQDILRVSVATAGNDHRLGANEAPPAILSIFLGDELTGILESLTSGTEYNSHSRIEMEVGINCLPRLPKDSTDRNRTSPMAFTGNKFEFRMVGSNQSIACTNVIMNTIVAESLDLFATQLESAENFTEALTALIKENYRKHSRIVFNGNNYSQDWLFEAKKRGLSNFVKSADVYPEYCKDKSVALFEKYKIYTREELKSRTEILQENYYKVINIEALTVIETVNKQIVPAITKYSETLAQTAFLKKQLSVDNYAEMSVLESLSSLSRMLIVETTALSKLVADAKSIAGVEQLSKYFSKNVITQMEKVRTLADNAELLVARDIWPMPTYGDLLFADNT